MDPPAQLQAQLRPDERLLWSGFPDPGVWLTAADAFMIPFSILWCAFVIIWEFGVTQGGSLFAELWGIPFVAIGVYLVAGRFGYKHYRKRRTVYGITTQRAVIARPGLLADTSLRQQDVTVRRSRDSRHASVFIGHPTIPAGRSGFRQASGWCYANTGLEPLARNVGLPFAFYDVADPEAMLYALDQARAEPMDPSLDNSGAGP